MTSITEVDPEDSGVSSSGATPDSQPGSAESQQEPEKTDSTATMSENLDEVLASAVVKMEAEKEKEAENNKTSTSNSKPSSSGLTLSLKTTTKPSDDDLDDDDDDDLDESFLERIVGLTEMFPESIRSTSSSLVNGSVSLIKSGYSFTRQAVWVAVSSSVILFAPVMFELERLNVEEMMKQDRNRLVLGPGSAMSVPPTTTPVR